MYYKWFIIAVTLICSTSILAQDGGYHFGAKGGLSLATQNWNNAERRFKLTNHFNVFIETLDPDDRGALFAQIGLHTRGSAIRFSFLNGGFGQDGYTFKNISLMLGAKKKINPLANSHPYYFFGIRAEYNVSNNLEELFLRYCTGAIQKTVTLPIPDFVNRFNYGASIGGGFEFEATEFFIPAIEITFSPDFGFQYDAPELNTIPAVPQTRIRNMTLEVSLVLKFLREIVYDD